MVPGFLKRMKLIKPCDLMVEMDEDAKNEIPKTEFTS